MLAARSVLRGHDCLIVGRLTAEHAVEVWYALIDGAAILPDALAPEEFVVAQEALFDAWERACWAPVVMVRKTKRQHEKAA